MWKFEKCPFCGGNAILKETYIGQFTSLLAHYVICEDCEISTPAYRIKEKAICAWNRRVGEQDAV